MTGEPFTVLNTGLPFVVLAALGVILPRLLLPRQTRSHRVLALVILTSGLLLFALGILGAALLKALGGADISGAMQASVAGTFLSLAKSSTLGIIAWGPFLAWSMLSLAQKIEERRGDDMRNLER